MTPSNPHVECPDAKGCAAILFQIAFAQSLPIEMLPCTKRAIVRTGYLFGHLNAIESLPQQVFSVCESLEYSISSPLPVVHRCSLSTPAEDVTGIEATTPATGDLHGQPPPGNSRRVALVIFITRP